MDDNELTTFIKVWISAIICLSYSYFFVSKLSKPIFRFIFLLPIFNLFIILPLKISSFHLCGITSFLLVWLATFKLILFIFNQPPLSSPPPSNLFHFISIALLPIKIKTQNPFPKKSTLDPQKPILTIRSILLPLKLLLLLVLFRTYEYKQFMHPHVVLALYSVHVYLELEIVLALCATPARVLFGFEIDPQFNEPYLATSLQDFWGRRWNLMVTGILRPTVYYPIKRLVSEMGYTRWAFLPGVFATFVVSGLMHELIYYYLIRVPPTWEVTWFFVLHGICTVIEVAVKKTVKWRLHRAVSGPLTVGFVAVTGAWLFFPQLVRNGMDDEAIGEYLLVAEFAKGFFGI